MRQRQQQNCNGKSWKGQAKISDFIYQVQILSPFLLFISFCLYLLIKPWIPFDSTPVIHAKKEYLRGPGNGRQLRHFKVHRIFSHSTDSCKKPHYKQISNPNQAGCSQWGNDKEECAWSTESNEASGDGRPTAGHFDHLYRSDTTGGF